MTPRGLLTTIGATALGFGLVFGGAPMTRDVSAQEATPPAAEAPISTREQMQAEFEAQRTEAYDAFVASLASELGSDEAAVDAAIRAALIAQVNEQEAAGEMDLERAAAARAVIEVSEAPLFLGFGGHGGMHGFDGPGGRHGGDRDDDDGRGRGGVRSDDDAPTSLPAADDDSDESASAPVTSDETASIG